MQKPAYTIPELEVYLRQKKAGQVNPTIEQHIAADPFLQTVIIGLEKTMETTPGKNTISFLENKKRKNWLALAPIVVKSNNATTTTKNIKEKLIQCCSIGRYDPQYLRIHLLLGFNCSCIAILAVAAIWLNSLQETSMLVSHLEELAGYKP